MKKEGILTLGGKEYDLGQRGSVTPGGTKQLRERVVSIRDYISRTKQSKGSKPQNS